MATLRVLGAPRPPDLGRREEDPENKRRRYLQSARADVSDEELWCFVHGERYEPARSDYEEAVESEEGSSGDFSLVTEQVAAMTARGRCSYMLLSLWFSWRIFRMTFITPFQEHLAVREVLILAPLTLVMLRMLAVVNMKAVSKLRSYIMRAPTEMSEIRAYHATQWSNIQSIRENGLRVSTQGMLGRGVYISRDLNKVWGYGGPAGAICELRVSVGRLRIIDRQHHPKQNLWSNEADMAYVPYRCGMVPSGLEEACVADAKRIQLVRVWDKRLLFVLLIYDIFRTILDPLRCFFSATGGPTWRWLCRAHEARNQRPKKRLWAHDLEHGAISGYVLDKCWRHEPHATVPPALLKKCDRSQ
eukprot:s319_g14.t1